MEKDINPDSGYCRLCAGLKPYSQLVTVNKDEEPTKDIIYKISQCFQVQITTDDNLPKTVCMECCMQTNLSYEFFQKVHRAQEYLRNVIFNPLFKIGTNFEVCLVTPIVNVNVESNQEEAQLLVSNVKCDGNVLENTTEAEYEQEDTVHTVNTFSDEELEDKIHLNNDKEQTEPAENFEKDFPNFVWFCNVCFNVSVTKRQLDKHFKKVHSTPSNYSCDECEKIFPASEYTQFTEHVRAHKTIFSCDICGKNFSQKNDFRRHMKTVHKQNLNTCPICSKEFKYPNILNRHKLAVHKIVGDKKLSDCTDNNDNNDNTENDVGVKVDNEDFLSDNNSQSAETSSDHVAHISDDPEGDDTKKTKLIRTKDGNLKRVRRNFQEEFPDYKWRCNVCPNQLNTRKELFQHVKREHNKSPEYTCNECGKTFRINRYKGFTRHVRQHSNNFPCKMCGKIFNLKARLQTHIKYSHEQTTKYICAICSKEFKRPTTLKTHEITHKNEDERLRYECDICHKKILSERTLAIHKKVHDESTKRYTCEVCGLTFRLKDTLETHIKNLHTVIPEDKYPQCPICSKKLKHEKQVRDHIRYTHKEKRFKCDTCGKQFYLLTHYRNHLTIHTGELPFECEYCKKRFRMKNGLQQHILQHTGEKPYCCFDCNHDFTDFSNYIKHMRRKHGVTSFKKVKKVSELTRSEILNVSSV